MFLIRHKNIFIGIAAVIFAVTIGIVLTFGLKLGIDFTGGALTEVSYSQRPEKAQVDSELSTLSSQIDLGGYSLRASTDDTGKAGYILRTRPLTESERQAVRSALTSTGNDATITRFDSVGPIIGKELEIKALWAIVAVIFVIIIYVAFAFRKVSKPVGSWIYGGITILALFHDVLVPTAFMSLLGHFVGAEVDVLFVTAILAVLGYSVNDTIVVFDRVRENLLINKKRGAHEDFGEVVGRSVEQTLTRSINTSLTTVIALIALYIFGGEVTQNFALVLIVGIIAGTYSSICIANPLLVYFGGKKFNNSKGKKKKK